MELKTSRNFSIAAHLAGWIVFLSIPILLMPGPGITQYINTPAALSGLVLKTLVWMGAFYFNYLFLTPSLLTGKSKVALIALLLIVAAVVSVAVGLIDEYFHARPRMPFEDGPPPQGFQPHGHRPDGFGPGPGPRRSMFGGPPFFSNILITIIVFSIASLSVLWNNWRQAKAQEQERALQKVAAELSVLKLQISPHFLFNTLNNIRWLIRSKSEGAEPAVLKLSQLLRYILYQATAEYVPLQREVDHLQDFISLQEMRITDKSTFSFSVEGDLSEKNIVPLLFLPAAENFFKHGDFRGGYVNRISLIVTASQVSFHTTNKVLPPGETAKEDAPGGIGLENIRKRLALHYPGKHTFGTRLEGQIFTLEMAISLA